VVARWVRTALAAIDPAETSAIRDELLARLDAITARLEPIL
jgi:hypothetical protein